ncbi:ABC transporter permease [Inhella gelatinilytica]|uniref:FtsX-like permease family protein n=1 Tax=Inhella gelatinilytica TaxID=2795030 RepID=A0A931NDL1_9BURK|nr:FtsX-like permease family protein [Inhella gelatinilytica]MBH9552724.1 FtsX-like permease family protein [Inhella gelatinilytica]
MNTLHWAWQRMLRDIRSGVLRLLALGMVLAVAAVASVTLLTARIDAGMVRDAAQLLGGDVVIASDQPVQPAWQTEAAGLGLGQTETLAFPSMARARDDQGGATRLVAVKAVDRQYPLRGRLRLVDGRTVGGPDPGTVWVDPAVLDALQLHVGDRVGLGDVELLVAGVIEQEPDRGAGFLNFAPRVMMARADVAASNLVQANSRVGYRWALVASLDQADTLRSWQAELKARLERGEWRGARLENLEGGRPELQQALGRGTQFFGLVSLLAALLATLGVALAAREYALQQVNESALLRVLGQSSRTLAWAYTLELLLVGTAACLVGLLAGWLAQQGLVLALRGLLPSELPLANWRSALLPMGLGLTVLLAFGLPPVLRLARVSPMQILRRGQGLRTTPTAVGVAVLGGAGFVGLLAAVAGQRTVALVILGGFAIALGVFAAVAALVWQGLKRLARSASGSVTLRLVARQGAARPGMALMQVAALGTGLLALTLLATVRTNLMESWRASGPSLGPDRFVINLQSDQLPAFRLALESAGVKPIDLAPTYRGRLVAINGKGVSDWRLPNERGRRLAEREFNLSHAAAVPEHNQALEGAWTGEGLSVEEGLARDLGLKVGDWLAFDMAGERVEAQVIQFRRVEWSSMRLNFFVLFQRSPQPEPPTTWLATFRAPPDRSLDRQLVAAFPNLTVVDVSAQLAQVQTVLDQVTLAIEGLSLFTLAAGATVLVGALRATREARVRDFALMRAMGASNRLLQRVQRFELLGLGTLAGALAGALSLGVSAVLATTVLELNWRPQLWIPVATAGAGALLAWGVGSWTLRSVLQRPVVTTLRAATVE